MDHDKEGKLTKRHQLPELKGVQFYTIALLDLDKDGDPEWLGLGEQSLNEESGLHVWDKQGNTLWKGDKRVGGTNNAIELEDSSSEDFSPRISFNSRTLITDINGDGKNEVLAIRNIPIVGHLLNFKVYKKSRLTAYEIDGTSLVPAWTTGEIDYCLVDMQADGRSLFLAAQKGRVITIGKGSGLIMWFE